MTDLFTKFSHQFGQWCRFVAIFSVLMVLGGCSSLAGKKLPPDNTTDEHQRQAQLAALKKWQVGGKLIFKSPQKKFSASLKWTQLDQQSDIRLTTFMGISIMRMVNDQYSATLYSDGQTFTSDSPEKLLRETTGITLPVNDLPQWLKGESKEYQTQTTEFDRFNRIKRITLLDGINQTWHIDYLAYQEVGQYQLPKTIRLAGGDIKATIKISKWELNPSD